MPDTRDTLQTQLDELRAIRAKGTSRVSYSSGSVEYRSDAELASAIADLERRLLATSQSPLRVTYLTSSKGT